MVDYDKASIVWTRTDAELKDDSKMYDLPLGRYPSVTEVLDPNNDFLWVHIDKIKEEVDLLSRLAAEGGDVESWEEVDGEWCRVRVPADQLAKDGSYISRSGLRYMKTAADRGTGVHFLFEAWGQGVRPDLSEVDEFAGWAVIERNLSCEAEELASFMRPAVRWLDKHNPEFEMQELVVCDPDKGYAGRTDIRSMILDGRRYIADVKSHDKLKRGWLMQLAAYRAAPLGFFKEGGEVKRIDIPYDLMHDPGCMIMVSPDRCGHRVIEPEVMDYYRDGFYCALDVHNRLKNGPLPSSQAQWIKEEG